MLVDLPTGPVNLSVAPKVRNFLQKELPLPQAGSLQTQSNELRKPENLDSQESKSIVPPREVIVSEISLSNAD